MAKVLVCDSCGQPTNEIVVKLFLTKTVNGAKSRNDHGAYTHHADIGSCCAERITRIIRWQKRKPKGSKNAGSSVGTKVA